MKRVILYILFSTMLFAYQKGDSVNVTKLGISSNGVYLVDFFASWCNSCQKELPLIKKLSAKGVNVIGIDVDENIDDANRFLQDMKLNFRVIKDPKGDIIKTFNPPGMPAIYIVKDGKVIDTIFGAHDNIDRYILSKIGA